MTRLTRLGTWAFTVCASAAAYGCLLDDRELSLGGAGEPIATGGQPSGGHVSASSGASPRGGEAGASGASEVSCADLDTDGTPDCRDTLLQNGYFDSDFAAWEPGEGTELAWSGLGASKGSVSGSLVLTATGPASSASQCLKFDAAPLLVAWGEAFIDANAEAETQAWIQVELFERDECAGDPTGFFVTPPDTEAGQWAVIQAGGVAPEGTLSLRVTVNALAPRGLSGIPIRFDNLMLKARPIN